MRLDSEPQIESKKQGEKNRAGIWRSVSESQEEKLKKRKEWRKGTFWL